MRIKVKCSEIYKYQQEAESKMKWLEEQYEKILIPVHNNSSFWDKLTLLFHLPLSLRMYCDTEHLATGHVLNTAKMYRETWHNYWGIINQFSEVSSTNEEVWLDSYETKTILSLRKFK